MPNANNLTNYCKAITRHMHALNAVLPEISSQQDDEAAYTAMYHLRAIVECMDKARAAGSDERGNDVLNAHEAVAIAIREAFPADPSKAALRAAVNSLLDAHVKEE